MNVTGKIRLTVLALTKSETSDRGKFTRQFFKGMKETSAIADGFLGAIVASADLVEARQENNGGGRT